MRDYNTDTLLNSIDKYKITHLPVVPPVLVAILKHPMLSNYDFSSVKEILCGALPLPLDVSLFSPPLQISFINIKFHRSCGQPTNSFSDCQRTETAHQGETHTKRLRHDGVDSGLEFERENAQRRLDRASVARFQVQGGEHGNGEDDWGGASRGNMLRWRSDNVGILQESEKHRGNDRRGELASHRRSGIFHRGWRIVRHRANKGNHQVQRFPSGAERDRDIVANPSKCQGRGRVGQTRRGERRATDGRGGEAARPERDG